MLWSCEALVRLARSNVPSVLVHPVAWPAEGRFASWPFRSMSVGGVECRLGHDGGRAVDLAFCVDAEIGRADLLAGHALDLARSSAAEEDPGVAGVWRFLREWHAPGSALHAHVPLVWLEFDHGPVEAGRPIPFVTFMIDDAIGDRSYHREDASGPELRRVLATGAGALLGGIDGAYLQTAIRAVRLLPEGGRLRHVAAMPHRGTNAVRGIVSLLRSEVGGYVGRLGWAGSSEDLAAALLRLAPLDHPVSIGLDITEGIQSSIGVEFHWPTVPARDGRWLTLLDELVRLGVCTTEQHDALMSWGSERGPADVRPLGTIHRHLLVKVSFGAAGVLGAKAYLTLTPRMHFP